MRDIGGADLVKLQFKCVLLIGKFVATCGFCIVSVVKILWVKGKTGICFFKRSWLMIFRENVVCNQEFSHLPSPVALVGVSL